jgi:hypothetical protein
MTLDLSHRLLSHTHLRLLNQSQKTSTVDQPSATRNVLTTFAAPRLATALVLLSHLLTQSLTCAGKHLPLLQRSPELPEGLW